MVESPVEQISDADRARKISGMWFGDDNPKFRELLKQEISAALTAARIEGEVAGMERAAEHAAFVYKDDVYANGESIAEAIRALAKELLHDPHG